MNKCTHLGFMGSTSILGHVAGNIESPSRQWQTKRFGRLLSDGPSSGNFAGSVTMQITRGLHINKLGSKQLLGQKC